MIPYYSCIVYTFQLWGAHTIWVINEMERMRGLTSHDFRAKSISVFFRHHNPIPLWLNFISLMCFFFHFRSLLRFNSLKMIFSPYWHRLGAQMFESHAMECKSMLFVSNHTRYLWGILTSFSNSFFDFDSYEGFSIESYQYIEASIMAVDMKYTFFRNFTFRDLLHKQNTKNAKQTIESTQYVRTGNHL